MAAHTPVSSVRLAIPIYGVTCWGSDACHIEAALKAVVGVYSVYVNPAMEMAYLQFDPETCGVMEFAETIRSLGFQTGEASIRST
jgi:copper chaperone CopZ